MKARIFAGIITVALASSAAQAGTTLSTEEMYSTTLPSITRDDYGLGSYYVAKSLQPGCRQFDLDPLREYFPIKDDVVNSYLTPQPRHVACLREASRG
ncbi:hypothetical protein ANRL4_05398 [Anaerolineae bacterium]|nr:hypothetical protein ANRL4_05398 [Anaerolineae bacterium]